MKNHDSDDTIQMTIEYIGILGKPFDLTIDTSML